MAEIVVTAESRTETGTNANRRLRRSGRIPGILYGPKQKTAAVSVSPKEVGAVLHAPAGTSTLFDLDYEGSRRKVRLRSSRRTRSPFTSIVTSLSSQPWSRQNQRGMLTLTPSHSS